jgi:hypothetical protein
MQEYLDHIIQGAEENGNEAAQVQIVFKPGVGDSSGGLRRGPIPGIYELCSFVAPGNIAPERMKQSDLIAASHFFEADAVQRVLKVTDEEISKGGPRIVTPGQA